MVKDLAYQYFGVVLQYLRINSLSDYYSSEILNDIIPVSWKPLILKKLTDLICNRAVFIFGAGPSLEESVHRVKRFHRLATFISANGATKLLLENSIAPHIVVTDLDGNIEAIVESLRRGSIVVVHGHGDNILSILKYVPKFRGNVIGTTQLIPWDNLMNFGGFTDGDRALYLALYFGARKIVMLGMDFGDVVGKYSKPWLKEHVKIWDVKRKKFLIAKELIEKAAEKFKDKVEIYIAPQNVEDIKYVLEVKYDNLDSIIGKN